MKASPTGGPREGEMGVSSYVLVLALVVASVPVALRVGGGLVKGKSGYSLVNLQLVLWTAYILVSYLVYLWKLQLAQAPEFDIGLSDNLLLLMGFSGGSYVGARTIRAWQSRHYASKVGGEVLDRPDTDKDHWQNMIRDYSGNIDISKVQMFAWTLVALFAYVVEFVHGWPQIGLQTAGLPNVNDTLVGLMGISQAAYLGRKALVERTTTGQ
jgi:hypothetical protein